MVRPAAPFILGNKQCCPQTPLQPPALTFAPHTQVSLQLLDPGDGVGAGPVPLQRVPQQGAGVLGGPGNKEQHKVGRMEARRKASPKQPKVASVISGSQTRFWWVPICFNADFNFNIFLLQEITSGPRHHTPATTSHPGQWHHFQL